MLAKILESVFTGFQWTTWKWFAILGEKAKNSTARPITISTAIIANEVLSTPTYAHLLRKLESEEIASAKLRKLTLSNIAAGITFYFVDSAIAGQTSSLQLFWRCFGVFFADGVAHLSMGKIHDCLSEMTANMSYEEIRNAYEAGTSAIAYLLGDQLATYISDSQGIDSQAQKDALSSLFILLGMALALPASRGIWNLSSYCYSFFRRKNRAVIADVNEGDFLTPEEDKNSIRQGLT